MVTKTYFKDYLKNNSIICVNNIKKRFICGTMSSLCLLLDNIRKIPKIRNSGTVRKGGTEFGPDVKAIQVGILKTTGNIRIYRP